jgi:hypothetical protein
MEAAVKLKVMIPASRRIELALPLDLPMGPAEVIVLTSAEAHGDKRLRPIGIDAGKGWVADDFDAPLPEDLQQLFEGRS